MIVSAVAFMFIWFLFAVLTAVVASSKGRTGLGWFLLGALFGIFALILVAILPNLIKRELRKVHKEVKGLAKGAVGEQPPMEQRPLRELAPPPATALATEDVKRLSKALGVSPERALELVEFVEGCDDDRKLRVARDYFLRAKKVWATNNLGAIELTEVAYALAHRDPARQQKIMDQLNWYKIHAQKPQDKESRTIRTKIVGVTKANPDGLNRQKILKRCRVGEKITLVRDTGNLHDKNAIKICRLSGEQLGWLSRELASQIGPSMDEGNSAEAEILNLTGGGLLFKRNRGCNIEIKYSYSLPAP